MTDTPLSVETEPAAETFEQWVEQCGDALYQYALFASGHPDQAADLLQETYLTAWRQRSAFRGEGSPCAWLRGILHHKLQDRWRSLQRTPTAEPLELDTLEQQLFDSRGHWQVPPPQWSPEAACGQAEFWEWLLRCMEQLPALQAAVFRHHELEVGETAQLCEALGISPNHLRVLLYRARLRLRQCLAAAGITPKEGV